MFDLNKLKKHDLVITLLLIPLTVIGLMNVFSTTYFPQQTASDDFKQQVMFFFVGYILYMALNLLDAGFVNQQKVQMAITFITSLALIALLVLPADPTLPARWLRIGPVSFQPSEFAKLVIILNTATAFSNPGLVEVTRALDIRQHLNLGKLKELWQNQAVRRILFNIFSVLLLTFLIIIQPSLGNGLIAFGLWAAMLATFLPHPLHTLIYLVSALIGVNTITGSLSLTSLGLSSNPIQAIGIYLLPLTFGLLLIWGLCRGLRANLAVSVGFLLLGILFATGANFLWNNALTEYQQDRIIGFLDPESDPLAGGWQVSQAKTAIASGQLFGKGFLQGTQSNAQILPYAYTDFAYAAYTEQFGWVGATLLLLLYQALIFRIVVLAGEQQDNFGRLICLGVAALLAVNTLINVGMNLGLLPVTGAPLPFVSYGGSAVLVNLLGLGLVQMVHSNRANQPWQQNLRNKKFRIAYPTSLNGVTTNRQGH